MYKPLTTKDKTRGALLQHMGIVKFLVLSAASLANDDVCPGMKDKVSTNISQHCYLHVFEINVDSSQMVRSAGESSKKQR